jgi:hypothetical protein
VEAWGKTSGQWSVVGVVIKIEQCYLYCRHSRAHLHPPTATASLGLVAFFGGAAFVAPCNAAPALHCGVNLHGRR